VLGFFIPRELISLWGRSNGSGAEFFDFLFGVIQNFDKGSSKLSLDLLPVAIRRWSRILSK